MGEDTAIQFSYFYICTFAHQLKLRSKWHSKIALGDLCFAGCASHKIKYVTLPDFFVRSTFGEAQIAQGDFAVPLRPQL